MKRLVAVVLTLVTFSLAAAPKEVATVRFTDTAGIVAAVAKVGEFIGNPMLVLPLTAGVTAQNPLQQLFGPGRAGAATAGILYVESSALNGKSPQEIMDKALSYAWLYPVTRGAAAFRAAHAEAVETNGLFRLARQRPLDDIFVAFSAKDDWVSYASTPEAARMALAAIPRTAKPLTDDVVSARVNAVGLNLFLGVLEAQQKAAPGGKGSEAAMKNVFALLGGIDNLSVALRVDDRGLTGRAAIRSKADSPWRKIGAEPLPAGDALAFAGRDAVYATAYAPNCGQGDFDRAWANLTGLVKKHGLDLSWLACAKKGPASVLTLDFDAGVRYFKGPGAAAIDKINPVAFVQDLSALSAAQTSADPSQGPAGALAVAVKGAEAPATPSVRFHHVAPEAAAKKPYMLGFLSYYSLLHALAPKMVALLPEAEGEMLRPLLAALPPEGRGGVAGYSWREGDRHCGLVRLSPDELKNLSAAITLGATFWSMRQAQAMQLEAEDAADTPPSAAQ